MSEFFEPTFIIGPFSAAEALFTLVVIVAVGNVCRYLIRKSKL